MNPAKEYLLQLSELEHEIQQLQWDMNEIRHRLGLQGLRYDSDRVQVSAGDPMAAAFAKLDKMEREQTAKIIALKARREVIHGQIRKIPEPYSRLLVLRYIRCLRFDKVADEMGYSYSHAKRMHGEALKRFGTANRMEVERWCSRR